MATAQADYEYWNGAAWVSLKGPKGDPGTVVPFAPGTAYPLGTLVSSAGKVWVAAAAIPASNTAAPVAGPLWGALGGGADPATAAPNALASAAAVGTSLKYAREDHVHLSEVVNKALALATTTGAAVAPSVDSVKTALDTKVNYPASEGTKTSQVLTWAAGKNPTWTELPLKRSAVQLTLQAGMPASVTHTSNSLDVCVTVWDMGTNPREMVHLPVRVKDASTLEVQPTVGGTYRFVVIGV